MLHLQVESRVHVHGHRFDPLAVLAEQFKERADRLAAVAVADPQHPCSLGIHDYRGVAMPLVQGEFVHHQAADVARIEGAYLSFQAAFVERFEGVPVQAAEAADVANRQQSQQAFEPDP